MVSAAESAESAAHQAVRHAGGFRVAVVVVTSAGPGPVQCTPVSVLFISNEKESKHTCFEWKGDQHTATRALGTYQCI